MQRDPLDDYVREFEARQGKAAAAAAAEAAPDDGDQPGATLGQIMAALGVRQADQKAAAAGLAWEMIGTWLRE